MDCAKTLWCFLLLLAVLSQGNLSIAADLPRVLQNSPSDNALDIPSLVPKFETQPDIKLPSVKQDADKLSHRFEVKIGGFAFEGNTAFSSEQLSELLYAYKNRSVNSAELQQIRIILNKHYTDKGYINSGAILPDQKIENGIITYRIIEGELKHVHLSGLTRFTESYIKKRIYQGVGKPLNIFELQNRLFLLQQSVNIRNISARLEPGTVLGEGVLKVHVIEESPYKIFTSINNHSPPSVGANRLEIDLVHNNFSGYGDALGLTYDKTKGLDDFSINYSRPINYTDLHLEVYYQNSDSEVIEGEFAVLALRNKLYTAGLGISKPLFEYTDRELFVGFVFEKRKSEGFLFGIPSPLTAGTTDGIVRVSVARIYQSWFKRSSARVLVARSTFSFGTDMYDATRNVTGPQSKSQSWLGQFQWVERLRRNIGDIVLRGNAQFSDDPLLSMEQISLGGARSVRGYSENLLTGDNGVNYSLEYRYPLLTSINRHPLRLVSFADYGRVWNESRGVTAPNKIYSIGIGLLWSNNKGTQYDIYWGKPFVDVNNTIDDLQKNGVHINFRFSLM